MRQSHQYARLGAVAALALALTSCSISGSSSTAPGGDGGGEGAVALTLGTPGQPPVFVNTVLFTAEAEGYFDDEGLDVTLRAFPTGADVGRAVQSGEIEGGFVSTPGTVALRANGGDAVAVYGFEHPSYLIGTTDLSVASCEDLSGKTIAVDAAGAPKAVALDAMLASCGLASTDVATIAPGGPQTVDAVVAGQVQLAVLHPDELAVIRESKDAEVVMTLAETQPLSHYTSLVATDAQLADPAQRETWVKVVRAVQKAIDYIYDPANADAVAQVAADMTTRPVEVTRSALEDFLDLEFWPIEGAGLTPERLQATIDDEIAAGNVPEADAPTVEDLADPSVFEDATK